MIQIDSKVELELAQYCKNFLVPNGPSLIPLSFEKDQSVYDFLRYYVIERSFDRLESVSFHDIIEQELFFTIVPFKISSSPFLLD